MKSLLKNFNFKKSMENISMKEHQETLLFFLISLFGNLLPILLGLLYYWTGTPDWVGWKTFYADGQFYLYSAAFLTSSAYIFYTFKVRNTGLSSILFILTLFLIILVSVLYAWKLSDVNNDMKFIRNTSLGIFGIALIAYYYSNFLNNKKIDVIEAQKKGIQEILNQL